MAIARLTVPKTTWAKLTTKLQKAEHGTTKTELDRTKQSHPPSGEAVLWEPSDQLRAGLLAILEREEGFVRKKGSCSHTDLLQTIKRLREFQPAETAGSAT
jgi:hypothetical protein